MGKRYALLVVLGYSRLLWCRFSPRQDMRTLLTGLEDAFLAFGGVPQELLFDQMKAVISSSAIDVFCLSAFVAFSTLRSITIGESAVERRPRLHISE